MQHLFLDLTVNHQETAFWCMITFQTTHTAKYVVGINKSSVYALRSACVNPSIAKVPGSSMVKRNGESYLKETMNIKAHKA